MSCSFGKFERCSYVSGALFNVQPAHNKIKAEWHGPATRLLSLTKSSKRNWTLLLVLLSVLVPLQTLKAGMVSVPPEVSPWQYDVKVNCVSLPTHTRFNQPPETTGVYNYQSCSSGGSFLSGESCLVDDAIEIMHLSGPRCPRPIAEETGDWISLGSSATFCGGSFSPKMSQGLEYLNLKP